MQKLSFREERKSYNFIHFTIFVNYQINFLKAPTSNKFETHYTHVFWGADYEYEDKNTHKFDFQAQNSKKMFITSFFILCR